MIDSFESLPFFFLHMGFCGCSWLCLPPYLLPSWFFKSHSLPLINLSHSLPPTFSFLSPPFFSPTLLPWILQPARKGAASATICLAATRNKHVAVDRRSCPGPEEQDVEDRPTWVGPALVLMLAQAAAGSSSHLARWSGVKLSSFFCS